LPLFRTAFTYINITRSPLVPGFIQGSVSMVTRGWGQIVRLDATNFTLDPDYPEQSNFNFTWFCRRVDPVNESYPNMQDVDVNLDGNLVTIPLYDSNNAQRIPKPRNPIIMSPPSGCYGFGPGSLRWSSPQLTVNTSCFTTYAQTYEIAMVVQKDYRWAKTSILIDVGVLPSPVAQIQCASAGICFPTPSGVMINPTTRLALTSNCVSQCSGGTLHYSWNLNAPGFNLQTVVCNPDLTTTTTVKTTTTTTPTPTAPPLVTIRVASFKDNSTGITMMVSVGTNGTIIVTTNKVTTTNVTTTVAATAMTNTTTSVPGRRKRQAAAVLGSGSSISGTSSPLIPSRLPVGCSSVFPSGLSTPVFAITSDFFTMNPKLLSFGIVLNITLCIEINEKLTCTSGISTLNIQINTPPVLGTCTNTNMGATGKGDFVNPGFNTALLDTFRISCPGWQDPQSVARYVFTGKLEI
jgi:hypothetical protein